SSEINIQKNTTNISEKTKNTSILGVSGVLYDGISAIPRPVVLTILDGQIFLNQVINTKSKAIVNTIIDILPFYEYKQSINSVDFGFSTQYGIRLISLSNNAQFQADDINFLNAYLAENRISNNIIDKLTAKWRWIFACAIAILAIVAVLYQWGIPLGAKIVAPFVPKTVKNILGDTALKSLDKYIFKPSTIEKNEQALIQQQWNKALILAYPNKNYPEHTVLFRSMNLRGKSISNAMALPNGTIVVTDGLYNLLKDKPNAIIGVLAHELGHLKHHHSMRAFLEFSSLGAISALLLGDYTVWTNQIPLFIGQMRYSRGHENEADDTAIKIMQAAKINPAELALFFERMTTQSKNTLSTTSSKNSKYSIANEDTENKYIKNDIFDYASKWLEKISLPDLLKSHPNSEERMKKLRNASL
ncbi:MAG: hypothetical protein RI956_617, partial [Pseudomonadota bacterium]